MDAIDKIAIDINEFMAKYPFLVNKSSLGYPNRISVSLAAKK